MLGLVHTGGRKDGKAHTIYTGADHYQLREAEVYLSQGKTVGQACKILEVSEQIYYRWRREYGGMDVT